MKRKRYIDYLFPRAVSALIIAAIIYGITYINFGISYDAAINAGMRNRKDTYAKILKGYDEGRYDTTFVKIFSNLYQADYLRFAKVNDDGSFETLVETDYDVIPLETSMRHWYFVTNDKELLAKGKETSNVRGTEWTIEYKKCEEAWKVCEVQNTRINNSFDLTAFSGDMYYASRSFFLANEMCGAVQFFQPSVLSYYVDGDTVHLGKVSSAVAGSFSEHSFGRKWDFTDPAKTGRYLTVEKDGYESMMYIMAKRERPDHFFQKYGDLFLSKNTNEMKNAYEKLSERDASFEGLFRYSTESGLSQDEFTYHTATYDPYTQGTISVFRVNGKLYMAQYVLTTVPFATFFKPFLIFWAVFLFVIAMAVSCISAIKPYAQYKKAYENNIFKNNLIDSLAHNMKTPLMILGGYAENLKDVTSEAEKDRYADQILAKTNEMNKDIEAILKTAEKSDRKFTNVSVRTCIDEVAAKLGADVYAKGDKTIKMDKDYFETAIYCLLDNAMKYKTKESKIEIDITSKAVTIKNKTDKAKFTPGTGLAIAGRILEQHNLQLRNTLKDGVFESKFGRKLGKEKKK